MSDGDCNEGSTWEAIMFAAQHKLDNLTVIIDYNRVQALGNGEIEPFAESFPDRYFNAGVAEQNMTGIACGVAMEGNIAITYSIANFPTLRCLEQIRNDVCYHNANVKIVIIGGGAAYGPLGISHHSTEDCLTYWLVQEWICWGHCSSVQRWN